MENKFFDRGPKRLNIDITHRCPLECLRCGRQTSFRNKGKKVPGYDISLTEFDIITDHFKHISFCGQYSDPIHHPKFLKILEICKQKNIVCEVHVASSFKTESWFFKAFETYPKAEWIFGIDGLPKDSHIYRKNQDGEKLFDVMLKSKEFLFKKPIWQYIIFNYNQHKIDEAMDIAKRAGVEFMIINSARWENDNDPLKPSIRR